MEGLTKRMRLLLFFSFSFFTFFSSGQNLNYTVLTMDKTMVKGANAVVRLDAMKLQVLAPDKLQYEVNQVVTVLNKLGDTYADSRITYDKEHSVKNLDVYIYDALGEEVEHFKKKDFVDASAADGFSLFNDDRVLRHSYTPVNYPYTIHLLYQIETSDTGFFPSWYFLSDYRVSVEKSHYEIKYATAALRPEVKEHNLEQINVTKTDEPDRLLYTATNIPAIAYEELGPAFRDIAPRLSVRLKNFSLKGEYGQVENWSDMGNWMSTTLLEGRDELSQETINKAKQLTAGINDDLEKAKIIYKYVQDNTRYISVQIGIGGWKPIRAIDVDLVKYGDCKGLSNYTYALLKAIGVTAYYTVIYAGKNKVDFQEDFAALQGNHAILAIPYADRYYWIDCTSQVHPFGFVGDFTDDRKALIVTPNGGQIVKTVAYINEDNSKKTTADYTLSENGDIEGAVRITAKGIPYDNRFYLERETSENVAKAYKEYWSTVNNLTIKTNEFSNDRDKIEFTETVSLEASSYATLSGNRMFFAPNAFDKDTYIPNRYENRTRSLVIDRGYVNENEFLIQLPRDYSIEAIPDNVTIANEFGEYLFTMEYLAQDHTIKYRRKLFVKKGTFEPDKYAAYRDFRKATANADNAKLVLIKKQ